LRQQAIGLAQVVQDPWLPLLVGSVLQRLARA
jgi:hypothetical protein